METCRDARQPCRHLHDRRGVGEHRQDVDPADQRAAWRPVHHDERTAETGGGVTRDPHGRSREALGRHLGVHDDLASGGLVLRHHANDQVAVELRRCALETNREDVGPEPAGDAHGRLGVLQLGVAGVPTKDIEDRGRQIGRRRGQSR